MSKTRQTSHTYKAGQEIASKFTDNKVSQELFGILMMALFCCVIIGAICVVVFLLLYSQPGLPVFSFTATIGIFISPLGCVLIFLLLCLIFLVWYITTSELERRGH